MDETQISSRFNRICRMKLRYPDTEPFEISSDRRVVCRVHPLAERASQPKFQNGVFAAQSQCARAIAVKASSNGHASLPTSWGSGRCIEDVPRHSFTRRASNRIPLRDDWTLPTVGVVTQDTVRPRAKPEARGIDDGQSRPRDGQHAQKMTVRKHGYIALE